MRAVALSSIAILIASAFVTSNNYSPFFSPLIDDSYLLSEDDTLELLKRQNTCPIGFSSCQSLGGPGQCCRSNAICSLDQANHVACCPVGAACTGTINAGSAVTTGATTGGLVFGGTISTTSPATTTTTTGFMFPTTTTAVVTAGGGGSTVPNAVFPFVYIPTTFENAAQCSSYYTSCQSEFSSCTASLGGGINGVTVTGVGGGVTVQGATATGNAASICSSLSAQACYGLQPTQCSAFGVGGGNTFVVSQGAGPTRCPGGVYEIGVGIAVGVAGVLV